MMSRKSFGYIYAPPRPGGVAMVDRTDGNTYYITDDGSGNPQITALPSNWGDHIYGANFGPIMQTPVGPIRLFLSNGVLDYDIYNGTQSDAPINTRRRGTTNQIFELTIGDTNIRITTAATTTKRKLTDGRIRVTRKAFALGDSITFALKDVT